MLISCCEWSTFGGHRTIIESDSFSMGIRSIHMSLEGGRLGRRGVHQISQHLHCAFNHVLQEANHLADGLTREGHLVNFVSYIFLFVLLLWLMP